MQGSLTSAKFNLLMQHTRNEITYCWLVVFSLVWFYFVWFCSFFVWLFFVVVFGWVLFICAFFICAVLFSWLAVFWNRRSEEVQYEVQEIHVDHLKFAVMEKKGVSLVL